MAKKLGAKQTIARVNNSEYLEDENKEYLKMIGIDSLIYPERLAAEEIVASLKQSGSRQLHEFSDGRLQLLGIKLCCLHQHIERSSKVLLIVGIVVVELVDVNTQHIHILFSRESLQEFFYRLLVAEIW